MKYLITGGAGFIGSHLCDLLIKKEHEVVCVDSFFSGKKENIRHLLADKKFTLIKHNIIHPLKMKFDKIDRIYHLACPASPMQYQFDPVLTTKTSVYGTINILDLARRYDSRVLFTSTSEAYGDPLEHPQKEEYFGNVDQLGKRSCYDEGKRTAESLCKDYLVQYKTDVRIVRLFNVYGPKMMFNDGRVISNFLLQALLGEDITVHGDGSQSRSFMYISDLLAAFDKVMELPARQGAPWLFNIGNPDERTIRSLAEDIKKISGTASEIKMIGYEKVPERFGDPQQRCPDISRAKKELGWEPKVGFEEGLRMALSDFKSRLSDKTKALVFIPSFEAGFGKAEQAAKEIMDQMSAYDFTLICARLKKSSAKEETIGKIKIYRLGWGNNFDKYLLPILGPIKALGLNKKSDFALSWSIMASYGALAAAVFSFLARKAYMISLFEDKARDSGFLRQKMIRLVHKLIFKRSHRLQVIAGLTQAELAAMEMEGLRYVDLEKGWKYVAKKTKEDFQQLEILSSRL